MHKTYGNSNVTSEVVTCVDVNRTSAYLLFSQLLYVAISAMSTSWIFSFISNYDSKNYFYSPTMTFWLIHLFPMPFSLLPKKNRKS